MNLTKRMFALNRFLYRLQLQARRLLPRQRCQAFGSAHPDGRIERIYVINLDRQPDRWAAARSDTGLLGEHSLGADRALSCLRRE